MIEGLKVTVKGTEVQELAVKQASFHKERSAFYRKQADILADTWDSTEGRAKAANYSGANPLDQAREKVSEHEDKAAWLLFISQHLELDEQYKLESNDLRILGIVRGRNFHF